MISPERTWGEIAAENYGRTAIYKIGEKLVENELEETNMDGHVSAKVDPRGYAATTEDVAKTEAPITGKLGQLRQSALNIRERVDLLRERLAPVLDRQHDPEKNAAPAASGSPLYDDLNSIIGILEEARDNIDKTITELEI